MGRPQASCGGGLIGLIQSNGGGPRAHANPQPKLEERPVSLAGDLARQQQRRVNGGNRRPARKYIRLGMHGPRMDRVVAGAGQRVVVRFSRRWSRARHSLVSLPFLLTAGELDITTAHSLRFLLCTCVDTFFPLFYQFPIFQN
jgi:hypothetical protein